MLWTLAGFQLLSSASLSVIPLAHQVSSIRFSSSLGSYLMVSDGAGAILQHSAHIHYRASSTPGNGQNRLSI